MNWYVLNQSGVGASRIEKLTTEELKDISEICFTELQKRGKEQG